MDGCKRRALVAKVSRELSDSDCRQLCYIYLKSESCPCLKQGNHLTALNELKKKGHFSLTDEGLKCLASCLEEIERVDLANLVRQSTSYSVQCEAAITKLERSPKLSEAEKPAIAQQLQRAVERVLEDSLKVREPDTLTVAREESSFGARGRSRLAAERDSAASQKNEGACPTQQHKLTACRVLSLLLIIYYGNWAIFEVSTHVLIAGLSLLIQLCVQTCEVHCA